MKAVTKDEAEETTLRLLAQIQVLATILPALFNPERSGSVSHNQGFRPA